MKRIISIVLLAAIILFTHSACSKKSNRDITVDVSSFSTLNCEQDVFTGMTFYYPSISGRTVEKDEFSRAGITDSYYRISTDYSVKYDFTALPVIRHNPNSDIPFQLECVLQYHYTFWDNHRCFSFRNAVIVTDHHRYNISQIITTSSLEVMGTSNIIPLGKIGMDMIKDICSSTTVKIQMTGTSESKEIDISSSAFKSMLEVINLYEAAGCGQYDFTDIDANIKVS